MSQYVVRELGDAAPAYLLDVLANSRTLAKQVASAIQGRTGRVYTYMPADVSHSELGEFETGGRAAMGNTLPWYVDLVGAYLRQERHRLCVLEDICSSPGDPWLCRSAVSAVGHIRIYQDEVYRVLAPEDADAEVVQAAIVAAASASFASGFMTAAPSGWDPASPTFSQPDLASLAQNVCKVAVGAYDLEGWIVWEAE
jgi:hypothetical protein